MKGKRYMFIKGNIPILYKKMYDLGYMDYTSDNYIDLYLIEWTNNINYNYDQNENNEIFPFGHDSGGHKFAFVENGTDEPFVGFCPLEDSNGEFWTKNFEDFIFQLIIMYLSDSWFEFCEPNTDEYMSNYNKLIQNMNTWINAFDGLINAQYIAILKLFMKRPLQTYSNRFEKWYAFMSIDDAIAIQEKYIRFPFFHKTFRWQS
jgi:hypothetical protein